MLRRSRMGEAAGRLADVTILTSDNPRWEDAETILDDIEAGIRPTGRHRCDRGKGTRGVSGNPRCEISGQ